MMFFDRSDESGKHRPVIFFVLASLVVGTAGTVFTKPGISTWYAGLIKSDFNPPNWLFAPVWTTLYILVGVAAARVWKTTSPAREAHGKGVIEGLKSVEMTFWIAQLVLNFFWSAIFFSLHLLLAALIEMGVLWLVLLVTLVLFWRRDRIAGLLLAPYLAWVSLAFALNLVIWRQNG
jgi:translocator protein